MLHDWFLICGILLGSALLVSGIILGIYHAYRCILGYTCEPLFGFTERAPYFLTIHGVIPAFILTSGVGSALGGLFAMYAFRESAGESAKTTAGFIAGGGLGVLAMYVMQGLNWISLRYGPTRAHGIVVGAGGLAGGLIGGIIGVIIGTLASLITLSIFFKPFQSDDITGMIPGLGWFAAVMAGGASGIFVVKNLAGTTANMLYSNLAFSIMIGIFAGVITGLLTAIGGAFLLFIERLIVTFVSCIATHVLIISRCATIICGHCLLYSNRFHAHYNQGQRYCEHCAQEITRAMAFQKIVLIFGAFPMEPDRRMYLLVNPDFQDELRPIDVSEVYIETTTCVPALIEPFLTYIVNQPPTFGLESVTIFYRDDLEHLGKHIQNLLQNNFPRLKPLDITTNRESDNQSMISGKIPTQCH